MADIFLSYARGDRPIAERLADALERAGMEVWFDRRISGGTTFSDVIEAELDAARKVVVLWSAESVKSGWVRDEATAANEMAKLVPVTIDGTAPPMGFRQIQTVDLAGWARKSGAALPGQLGEALALTTNQVQASDSGPHISRGKMRPALLTAGAVVLLGGAIWAAVAGSWFTDANDDVLDVAVEPLEVTSGDAPAQALSKGLVDDLARLAVDASADLAVVTDNDEADMQLTGSAESSGGVLHATVRLLGNDASGILWSRSFERPVGEAGALREEIATRVTSVLTCAQEAVTDQLSIPAQRLYLSACDKGGDDMAAGLMGMQRVLEVEPDFLPAKGWAAGFRSAIGGNMRNAQGRAMRAQAVRDAEAILKEHPERLELYGILSDNLSRFDQWEKSTELLEEAVSKKPVTSIIARQGFKHVGAGYIEKGITYTKSAQERAPYRTIPAANLAELLAFSGRLPEALALIETMRVRNPNSLYMGTSAFEIAARVGDPADALAAIDRAYIREAYSPEEISVWRALLAARADPARKGAALSQVDALQDSTSPQVVGALLQDYVQLGDLDGAFRLANRHDAATLVNDDIWWRNVMAPMRADPRFPALIEKIGPPKVWRATGRLPDYCATEKLPYDCRKVFLKKA